MNYSIDWDGPGERERNFDPGPWSGHPQADGRVVVSAVISSCGSYRYRLERTIGDIGPTVVFIMVNPSTADSEQDDATIRTALVAEKQTP